MAGFKHVIFDVDGTLADTEDISQRALQDLLFERTGEEEDFADLAFTRGIPGDKALAQLGIFDEGTLARWDELAREHADEARLFYGVREMLEGLQESGKAMGVVSSRRHDEYEAVITPLGIDGYFESMVLADDTERHKPEPDPLLEYLRRTGARPEETIYVGDTAHDSQAARAAGISFVFAGWGRRQTSIRQATGSTRPPKSRSSPSMPSSSAVRGRRQRREMRRRKTSCVGNVCAPIPAPGGRRGAYS